ncbi:MAG: hypothetical protein VX589_10425 [Myxococcota bacterium]|nr:hypothetical protein [Myxococcota bacterium]
MKKTNPCLHLALALCCFSVTGCKMEDATIEGKAVIYRDQGAGGFDGEQSFDPTEPEDLDEEDEVDEELPPSEAYDDQDDEVDPYDPDEADEDDEEDHRGGDSDEDGEDDHEEELDDGDKDDSREEDDEDEGHPGEDDEDPEQEEDCDVSDDGEDDVLPVEDDHEDDGELTDEDALPAVPFEDDDGDDENDDDGDDENDDDGDDESDDDESDDEDQDWDQDGNELPVDGEDEACLASEQGREDVLACEAIMIDGLDAADVTPPEGDEAGMTDEAGDGSAAHDDIAACDEAFELCLSESEGVFEDECFPESDDELLDADEERPVPGEDVSPHDEDEFQGCEATLDMCLDGLNFENEDDVEAIESCFTEADTCHADK